MVSADFRPTPPRHDEGSHVTHIHGPIYGPVHTGAGHIFVGSAAEAPTRPEFKRYLRMLGVVAAPVTGASVDEPPPAPLDLWAEWRRLEDAVYGAWDEVRGQGAAWAAVRLNPPTRDALGDALVAGDAAYQVVHFSGHGAPDGLALEDALGRLDFVTTDDLVRLFRGAPVRLVVLNACETVAIADRLVRQAGVPAAIAMCQPVRDDEARLLTGRLYARLARGQAVGDALAEALAALERAYRKGDLPIPSTRAADRDAYIAERLAVPQLHGDPALRLALPPEDNRATEPLISLAEPPSNLRYDLLPGFVGRGRELVQLAGWLDDRPSPVLVISGLGGLGKSALAKMTALRCGWRFRAVVELSAKDDPADCNPDALAAALDAVLELGGVLNAAPTSAARQQQALDVLNRDAVLLVLDNFESLDEAQTRAWHDFLARLDPRHGSSALLTLRPAAKHPLTDLAGVTHLRLERLAPGDALRLLADGLEARRLWNKVEPVAVLNQGQKQRLETLAWQAHLDWAPLSQLAALDGWAERAGRHPFQLRLALAALAYNHNTWAGVGERLNDLRGRDWEQQAESLVGASLDDLAAHAAGAVELLQAMLVFRGGASYEALRAVAAGRLVKPSLRQLFRRVVRTRNLRRAFLEHRSLASMTLHVAASDEAFHGRLAAAVDSNLLEEGTRQAHYDLHPLTRAYLENRRPPDPAHLLAYRGRHAAHFLEYAEKRRGDFDALEAELPNLRAGFEFATAESMRDEAMICYYGGALYDMLNVRYYRDDVLAWMTQAARSCEVLGDKETLSICYNHIGLSHWDRSDYRGALEWLKKTAVIDEARGDKAGQANTYNAIGVIYTDLGEMDLALNWLDKAQVLWEEVKDKGGLATTWANIGGIYYARGAYERALGYLERAAPVLEEIGDRAILAGVFNNIGRVYHARGAYERALDYYERAAPVLEEIGDRAMLATVFNNIGMIYHARGAYERALGYYERAAPVLEEIGDRAMLATVFNNIGQVYYARGAYERALGYYERAAPVLEEIGDRAKLATVFNNIGQVYYARGAYDRALGYLERAAPVLEEIGDRATLATVLNNIGMIYYARGAYDRALGYFERAAPVLEEIGDRAMLATVLNNIGQVYYARGAYDRALGYFERAAPVLEEIGDRAKLAGVLNNIGLIYHARGAYDRALGYLERAAPVLEEIGDRAMLATVQGNLAMLYLRTGDDAAAEAYLRRNSALFDELGLDTDDAEATREYLSLGLTKGWDAARRRFAGDKKRPTSPVQDEKGPILSPVDILRSQIVEAMYEESGADSANDDPQAKDANSSYLKAAEIGSGENP